MSEKHVDQTIRPKSRPLFWSLGVVAERWGISKSTAARILRRARVRELRLSVTRNGCVRFEAQDVLRLEAQLLGPSKGGDDV